MKKYLLLLIVLFSSAILLEGFQCASPTMSDAKSAYSKNDYDKALQFLNEELSKNPNNAEAYLLRGQIYYQRGNLTQAADDIAKAQEYAQTPEQKSQANKMINQIWVESYNKGLNYLSNYYQSQNATLLDTALYYFDTGIKIRPEIADFRYYKASVYESLGDTSSALNEYAEYMNILSPEVEFAKSNNIYLGMPYSEVTAKYGVPDEKNIRVLDLQGGIKINSAHFTVNGTDLYVFAQSSPQTSHESYWMEC